MSEKNVSGKVRIGVVGLGFMAATHIRAYQKVAAAEIVALCSPSGRHLDGDFTTVAGNINTGDPLKLDVSNIRCLRDFNEMIAMADLDLVDICAPTAAHPALAKAALAAGKHVLCEKPMARTSAEAKEMVAAARAAGRILMPAMPVRFWPEWAWVREAIQSKQFGRALSARFRRVAEPPGWGAKHFGDGKLSGGALLDLHVHDTDFVQYCFGKPTAVFSRGYIKYTGAVDHVVTQYEVPGRTIVHAEGSWAMARGFGFSASYTVNFERATVDFDMVRGPESLKVFEDGKTRVVTCEGPDGYVREVDHILSQIQSGARTAVIAPEEGLHAVQICEAEERSVQSGKVEPVIYS
jgi:predicted dehydrogenase